MLRILGTRKQCCDGISRRDFLEVGSLSLLGLGLTDLLQAGQLRGDSNRVPESRTLGKAKSVIVLFLYGAPSQMDTMDPKPDAPVEVRGTFKTIPTILPGVHICEHLPNMARLMHRVTLVRSMTHPYPTHAVAYALTGVPISDGNIEANRRVPQHWPYFGSTLDYLWSQQQGGNAEPSLVRNLIIPWPRYTRTPNAMGGGMDAAWLAPKYQPVFPEFVGRATGARKVPNHDPADPFFGITPDSTFRLPASEFAADITLDRFNRRQTILEQLDSQTRQLDRRLGGYDRVRQAAFDLMTSPKVPQALDVTREPEPIREKYGYTLFGQGALAARRLIEAGSRVVMVFWDEYGPANSAWDTHEANFPRLKDGLLPTLDQVFPALLDDLESRGMLDETLVLLISEHGRTPKLDNVVGGGRGHWGYAYWGLFAGAGISRGRVIGATDRQGGFPSDRPLNPKDILATVYHLLGFDPHGTQTRDSLGREHPLLPYGEIVPELLA